MVPFKIAIYRFHCIRNTINLLIHKRVIYPYTDPAAIAGYYFKYFLKILVRIFMLKNWAPTEKLYEQISLIHLVILLLFQNLHHVWIQKYTFFLLHEKVFILNHSKRGLTVWEKTLGWQGFSFPLIQINLGYLGYVAAGNPWIPANVLLKTVLNCKLLKHYITVIYQLQEKRWVAYFLRFHHCCHSKFWPDLN